MSEHNEYGEVETHLARIANRLRLTEGQLYTLVTGCILTALILATTLPGTGHRSFNDGGVHTTVTTVVTTP